jgi:hypothetical protein
MSLGSQEDAGEQYARESGYLDQRIDTHMQLRKPQVTRAIPGKKRSFKQGFGKYAAYPEGGTGEMYSGQPVMHSVAPLLNILPSSYPQHQYLSERLLSRLLL